MNTSRCNRRQNAPLLKLSNSINNKRCSNARTTGRLQIMFNKALSEAKSRLCVHEGVAITQAHLHCARAAENGPVVAFLFGPVVGGVM